MWQKGGVVVNPWGIEHRTGVNYNDADKSAAMAIMGALAPKITAFGVDALCAALR